MKKYVIEIKQHSEGCDYTIGCGRKTFILWAKDIKQAHERFELMFQPDFDSYEVDWTEDYGEYHGDQSLKNAVIYEVAEEVDVNMDKIYTDIERLRLEIAQKEVEAKEKAEYERLKNKYGN